MHLRRFAFPATQLAFHSASPHRRYGAAIDLRMERSPERDGGVRAPRASDGHTRHPQPTSARAPPRGVKISTPALRTAVQRSCSCRWGDRRDSCQTACWRTWAASRIATQAHSLVPDPRDVTGPPTVIGVSDLFSRHVARLGSKTAFSPKRESDRAEIADSLRARCGRRAFVPRDDPHSPSDAIAAERASQAPRRVARAAS